MEEGTDSTGGGGGFPLTKLPVDCISAVIAFTSPRDACRLAAVSRFLNSVADSDAVWEKFLPQQEHLSVVPRGRHWSSKKGLYLSLGDPFLIDDGGTSPYNWVLCSLEKGSGKWCYMLPARSLKITQADLPRSWEWIPQPDGRFPEVVKLLRASILRISCCISAARLSADTLYKSYLVFKHSDHMHGFETLPVMTQLGVIGSKQVRGVVNLDGRNVREGWALCPKSRGDGWLEVELGEIYIGGDLEENLHVSVVGRSRNSMSGVIIEGIDFRPSYKVKENEVQQKRGRRIMRRRKRRRRG